MSTFDRFAVSAEGAVTKKAAKASYLDAFIGAVRAPLDMLSTSAEKELITEREAGVRTTMGIAAGYLGGERHGQARASQGKKPFLNFL